MRLGRKLPLLTALALSAAVVYALTASQRAGDAALGPATGVPTAASSQDPGAATYDRLCQACHGSGAAGAPRLGDTEAWAPRIVRGPDALLLAVREGKGAMPPRGTCGDCSDADLRAAIDYLISKVR
jgi:cytochrome c5